LPANRSGGIAREPNRGGDHRIPRMAFRDYERLLAHSRLGVGEGADQQLIGQCAETFQLRGAPAMVS